ncbi:phage holin family protein [Candidatus Parcubacteria bacterium]|nr:phage holin family protein [Candidatus Parcubacteria bacterium]
MERLFWHIVAGVLSIFLAARFVPGASLEVIPGETFFRIEIAQEIQALLLVGGILGIINFFIRPIINRITLPLRILTLGLFPFILDLITIWLLDVFFQEFTVLGLTPLFFTAAIVWITNFFLGLRK